MVTPVVGIKELAIRNFRGLDDLTLDFRDPKGDPCQLVVLAGPNGTGKTAVLEACLHLLGHLDFPRGSIGDKDIRVGADDFDIRAKVRINGSDEEINRNVHGAERLIVPADGAVMRRGSTGRTADISCLYYSSWRKPSLVGAVGISLGKKGKRHADTEANRFRRLKQFLVDTWAKQLIPESSQTFERLMNEVNARWKDFFPDSFEHFQIQVEGTNPDDGLDVYLTTPYGLISVDSLSSGQIELFTFIVGLLSTYPEPAMIVIDEPELHLDPQWHRLVLQTLVRLSPKSQVIVATHSPEIYDSARSFERHFLVPKNDPRAKAWTPTESVEAETP